MAWDCGPRPPSARARRWAAYTFAVENVTLGQIASRWCTHCDSAGAMCRCPDAARRATVNATGGRDRVRARRGHGRKRTAVGWEELRGVDGPMAEVARRMARDYGYF